MTSYYCQHCKNKITDQIDHEEWCLLKEDKSQMTREEALNKFHQIVYPESFNSPVNGEGSTAPHFKRDRAWSIKAIAAYEALGLIKFEEEKIKSIDDCLTPCFGSFAGRDAVKKALDDAGYKIVRK